MIFSFLERSSIFGTLKILLLKIISFSGEYFVLKNKDKIAKTNGMAASLTANQKPSSSNRAKPPVNKTLTKA